jgi:hypothetical protein
MNAIRIARGRASTLDLGGLPNAAPRSYVFEAGAATHLKGALRRFTSALALYSNGELAPAQLIEEAHTILELVLRSALGDQSRDRTFAGMVKTRHRPWLASGPVGGTASYA